MRVEEFEELDAILGAVPVLGLEHDLTGVHIECGEQRSGAVPAVLELSAFSHARTRRFGRVGTALGLHPGLLVNAEHQGVALSGGLRYKPHASLALSQNVGSWEVSHDLVCQGLRSRSSRIRHTCDAEIPTSEASRSATARTVQRESGSGGSSVTAVTIRSRSSWLYTGGRPGRGASPNPSKEKVERGACPLAGSADPPERRYLLPFTFYVVRSTGAREDALSTAPPFGLRPAVYWLATRRRSGSVPSVGMRRTPLEPWIARKIGSPAESIAPGALASYQRKAVADTVQQVRERSRFYRRHLPAGADSADLETLPFTTADDIRGDPMGFVCVSQSDIHRIVTLDTSGTTGAPKRVSFTLADQELTIDFFEVGMSTFTDPGDRVLILLPGETPGSVGDLLATGLTRLGAVPIKHGPVRDPAAALEVMTRERVDVAVGVPTHVLSLARRNPSPRLKSVLLSTDHVPGAVVRAIEDAWGCVVYNHYGMTEMGLGGGVECEAREGYHLREADMIFEIVDPDTGRRCPDGRYGEVVFTTLTRAAMPLVRYRTGDVSRFVDRACPCGSSLALLEQVRHRLDGLIPLGGAHLTMADLDDALFPLDHVVDFTAIIDDAGLSIRIKSTGYVDLDSARRAVAAIPAAAVTAVRVEVADAPFGTMGKRRITDARTGLSAGGGSRH